MFSYMVTNYVIIEEMKQWGRWTVEERVERTIVNLQRHGFDVRYCETISEANEIIDGFVRPGDEVGFGGSVTITEMAVADYLRPKNVVIIDHNLPGLGAEGKNRLRRRELVCDVFLTSSNAVTEAGQLLNVDGIGNRVAAMMYGPGKVVVACGVNKLVPDIAAAYERVRAIAAPKNNARLATGNPCLSAGHCVDCQREGRICNLVTIMERKPMQTDITIIVINEMLGY